MGVFFEISAVAKDCPVACDVCPQDKLRAAYTGPRLMSFQTFKTCLDKMPAGCFVSFAGFAEGWLNPAISDMVRYTRETEHEFEAYSTAVGMSESDAHALADARPQRVTLHLADSGSVAKINVTDQYLRVLAILKERTPWRAMAMGPIHPTLLPMFGNLPEEYLHSRAGNVKGSVRLPRAGALKCRAANELDHNVLLPSGDLVVCCMDYSLQHVIGNQIAQTWEEIRSGEPLRKLREAMGSQSGDCLCRRCEFSCAA